MSSLPEIRSRARLGVRGAVLIGLMLLFAGCDKCGDWVHVNAPSLPKNCTASDAPHK
jgi:hypothetical protein